MMVNGRKMTYEDRKHFRRAKEAKLQSWLDHKVFDVVNKKVADKDRVMGAQWVLTWKSTGKEKAISCAHMTAVPRNTTTLSARAEALILQ